jgi:glutamine---fructose-6-phosphate transaminase (isomerizing)
MSTCVRCLLPETFPDTRIGADGVCNHCRDYVPLRYKGHEALVEALGRSDHPSFDCVVPVSGGKDSAYALWYVTRKLGLRPLAVHYANPMADPIGTANVHRICEKFGVKLEIAGTESGSDERFVRHYLKASVPLGITWGACTFCHYGISASVYRTARKEGIRQVVWANSPFETILFFDTPWEEMSYAKLVFQPKAHLGLQFRPFVQIPFGENATPKRVLRAAWHIPLALKHSVAQRLELLTGPVTNLLQVKPRSVGDFDDLLFYTFVRWDGKAFERVLTEELDWRKPDFGHSSWRFDCRLFPLTDQRWRHAFGISFTGIYASCLVREGLISTDEARTMAAVDTAGLKSHLEALSEFIGLDSEELCAQLI